MEKPKVVGLCILVVALGGLFALYRALFPPLYDPPDVGDEIVLLRVIEYAPDRSLTIDDQQKVRTFARLHERLRGRWRRWSATMGGPPPCDLEVTWRSGRVELFSNCEDELFNFGWDSVAELSAEEEALLLSIHDPFANDWEVD